MNSVKAVQKPGSPVNLEPSGPRHGGPGLGAERPLPDAERWPPGVGKKGGADKENVLWKGTPDADKVQGVASRQPKEAGPPGEKRAGFGRPGGEGSPPAGVGGRGCRAHPVDLRGLLLRHRLIPSARLSSEEDAVPLAEALQRAGLPLLQVSLTTSAALPAIEAIRAALPDFHVGAGTILSPGQINDALSAGAHFGAGPAMHPGLLAAALSAEFPFLPGAMTPSEIECGIQWGFLLQGFCPAAAAGGPEMVRALAGPYRHTRLLLVPSGGLRLADFQEYLVVPEVGAVAGRFLCEGALIEAGMWEDIEAQALLCMRKTAAALRARLAEPRYEKPLGEEPEEIYR